MTVPVQIQPAAGSVPVDAAVLRREMESRIEGEVRFDAVTRSLYSHGCQRLSDRTDWGS